MRARINGLKLHGYPLGYCVEYCVRYSLVDSIPALADCRGEIVESQTWMEEWSEYGRMKQWIDSTSLSAWILR